MISPFHKQDEPEPKKAVWRPKTWAKGLTALVSDYEYHLVCLALHQTKGHIANAAHRMGINRTTLVEKLKSFGINKNDYKD